MSARPVDHDQAQRYLAALGITGTIQAQTFDDSEPRKKERAELNKQRGAAARAEGRKLKPHEYARDPFQSKPRGTYEQLTPKLESLQGHDAGVFVQINDGADRGINHITHVRAFFAEVDKVDGRPATYEEARALFADFPLAPTVVVEPKKGAHFYWAIEPTDDPQVLDQFAIIQEALALKFSGDRALVNLDRVMRVPGYWHHKDPANPKRVELRECQRERVYTVAQVLEALGGWDAVKASVDAQHRAERAAATPSAGRAPKSYAGSSADDDLLAKAKRTVKLRDVMRGFGEEPPDRDYVPFACPMSAHTSFDSARIVTGDDGLERLVCQGDSCKGKGHTAKGRSALPMWDAFDYLTDPNGGGMTRSDAAKYLLDKAGLKRDYKPVRGTARLETQAKAQASREPPEPAEPGQVILEADPPGGPATADGFEPVEYGVSAPDELPLDVLEAIANDASAPDAPPEKHRASFATGDGSEYGLSVNTARYHLDATGVYAIKTVEIKSKDTSGKEVKEYRQVPDTYNPIASRPFFPSRIGRDVSSGHTYIRLTWATSTTGELRHEWHPERTLRDRQALNELDDVPFGLDKINRVSGWLSDALSFVSSDPLTLTTRVGWIGQGADVRFVLAGGDKVEFIGEPLASHGTPEGWLEGLHEFLSMGEGGYLGLAFCGASSGAPCTRLADKRRGVWGSVIESSRGKGTVIRQALAIWTNPDDLTVPAGSTHKGTQDRGKATPDFPLFVDELQQALKQDPRKVEDQLYFLGNGQVRVTSSQKQKAVGGQARYGVSFFAAENEIVRDLQKGAQFRVIELHGQPLRDAAMAKRVQRASRNYGVVGPLVARVLNDNRDEIPLTIEEYADGLAARHPNILADDAYTIAVAVVGLELLEEALGLELPSFEVGEWVAKHTGEARSRTTDDHERAFVRLVQTVQGADWTVRRSKDGDDLGRPDVLVLNGFVVAFRGVEAYSSGQLDINPAAPQIVAALREHGGESSASTWAARGWIERQARNLKWPRRSEPHAGVSVWRVSMAGLRVAGMAEPECE